MQISALDNLETGTQSNLKKLAKSPRFKFRKFDMAENPIPSRFFKDAEVVFHLAANPEVRIGSSDTLVDFNANIVATRNLLESLRNGKFHGKLIFTSTSAVYGEPSSIPTAETYGPLIPISMYAASKLACEALIFGYAKLFDFTAVVLRFANVVGTRSNHGVVYDFIRKLTRDKYTLEVLGDGSQTKSYIHIDDCISAILHVVNMGGPSDIFNVGTNEATNVMKIAQIVCNEMNLPDARIVTKKVTKDGRAWAGDVKNMLLDCSRIAGTGWRYSYTSDEAIRRATREILSS